MSTVRCTRGSTWPAQSVGRSKGACRTAGDQRMSCRSSGRRSRASSSMAAALPPNEVSRRRRGAGMCGRTRMACAVAQICGRDLGMIRSSTVGPMDRLCSTTGSSARSYAAKPRTWSPSAATSSLARTYAPMSGQARAAADRRPRASTRHRRPARPGPRPAVHHDLADRVEVEVVRAVQLVEQPRQLPAEIAVQVAEQAALGVEVVPVVVVQIVAYATAARPGPGSVSPTGYMAAVCAGRAEADHPVLQLQIVGHREHREVSAEESQRTPARARRPGGG